MNVFLSSAIVVALVTSCGGSSGGGKGKRPSKKQEQANDAGSTVPSGEKAALKDTNAMIGKSNIRCSESGYGSALDDKMNEIVVCCVALSQSAMAANTLKFVKRSADSIEIKPEKCDAVALSGSVGAMSLPMNFNFTAQKFVTLSMGSGLMFANATGAVSVEGGQDFGTKLVGPTALVLYGNAKIANIHSLGTPIAYGLREGSGSNNFSMANVKIEGKDELHGGLTLSGNGTTTSALSGLQLKFENVSVEADMPSPVNLVGYPFDIAGIEVTQGKKYAPHIGFSGSYIDTTGVLGEKRYPVVTRLDLTETSFLKVGPGVKIKVPVGGEPFRTFNPNISLEGSAEEHVVVTSASDDTVGGDTNGDGNATKGGLVKLIANPNGGFVERGTFKIQYTDLIGTLIQVRGKANISIGNSEFKPSQDGAFWKTPIFLLKMDIGSGFSTLTIDGPTKFTQPIETYTGTSGNLHISAPIFAASFDHEGTVVKGIDLISIVNSSTSTNRLSQDVRVTTSIDGCQRMQDSSGQVTTDSKAFAFYVKDDVVKACN